MNVAITDASVFFDILETGILPEFFSLDLDIYTTDFIFNEIEQSDQKELFDAFVRSNKLKILSIDETEQQKISEMEVKYLSLSYADKSILYKAIEKNCTLLTCDAKLKKEAESKNLKVYGSIWVVDELLNSENLAISKGINILEKLLAVNPRLPKTEINNRINNLKRKLYGQ